MEFLEGFFKRLWKTEKQKALASPSRVFYHTHGDFLESLVLLCLGSSQGVRVRPVDSFCGCADGVVYLPESIDVLPSYEENLRLYKYALVKSAGAYFVRERVIRKQHDSLRAQVLESLFSMDQLNREVDIRFPEFRGLEREIESCLDAIDVGNCDLANLWRQCRASRTDIGPEAAELLSREISRQKRNDRLPGFLSATVPVFIESDEQLPTGTSAPLRQGKGRTEIKKRQSRIKPVKSTKLKDKEINPVIHSFEKLETLDSYEGGRRFDSGDDELAKHENALDEVDLSQVTTDGESSNSIYSVEDYGFRSKAESGAESIDESIGLTYDEWDFRLNGYRKNHCFLSVQTSSEKADFPFFAQRKSLYDRFIQSNRKKFIFFKNDARWISRQPEGEDVDTSLWSRFCADRRAGHSPSLNVYLKREKREKSVSILFLFDQSLSTESWIGNQEIMSIIKDSLFIAGESLSGILEDVCIASAYSVTRKNCVYKVHKDWDTSWAESYGRIFSSKPTGYTRLGPSVRHSVHLLSQRKSKKKLLFVITDGKVSDIDPYEGRYGLHDMKKAISEAEKLNIKTIGITLDREIKSYFRIMFGKYRNMNSADEVSDILFKSLQSVLRR